MSRWFLAPPIVLALAACSKSDAPAVSVSPKAALETAVALRTATVPPTTATTSPARTVIAGGDQAQPSGDRALQHVQMLAGTIGPRVAGTDGEHAAADYIESELKGDGYTVQRQAFTFQMFVARSTSLSITGAGGGDLTAAPLTNSSPGKASAELVFAGVGQPPDFPAGGMNGRIALVQRGTLTFTEKARNAVNAGASALIVYDPPANPIISGTLADTSQGIPVLTVSGEDGSRLRQRLDAGEELSVALTFDGGLEDISATNVIGHPSDGVCNSLVGAHYDSVPGTQAANDNASGTATVLELARVEALRGNPEHACFIGFSGEEEGLNGSQYYVNHLTKEQKDALHFMINLDMEAVGDSWKLIGSRDLQARAQDIASGMGITASPLQLIGASSDHASFLDAHIPALMLHRWNDQLLHTPRDNMSRITAPPLEESVRLALAFLINFSGS